MVKCLCSERVVKDEKNSKAGKLSPVTLRCCGCILARIFEFQQTTGTDVPLETTWSFEQTRKFVVDFGNYLRGVSSDRQSARRTNNRKLLEPNSVLTILTRSILLVRNKTCDECSQKKIAALYSVAKKPRRKNMGLE